MQLQWGIYLEPKVYAVWGKQKKYELLIASMENCIFFWFCVAAVSCRMAVHPPPSCPVSCPQRHHFFRLSVRVLKPFTLYVKHPRNTLKGILQISPRHTQGGSHSGQRFNVELLLIYTKKNLCQEC